MPERRSKITRQIEKQQWFPPTEYDPEAPPTEDDQNASDDSDSDDGRAALNGTEHYSPAKDSTLRKGQPVTLGSQYRGQRVSKSAVLETDSDELEEDDGSSIEDMGRDGGAQVGLQRDKSYSTTILRTIPTDQHDQKKAKQLSGRRHVAADFISSEEEDDDEGESNGPEDFEEGGDSDGSSEQEDSAAGDLSDMQDKSALHLPSQDVGPDYDGQAAIHKGKQTGQREMEKGKAIQAQRSTFDGLLGIRIRLQKALVAANSFHVSAGEAATTPSQAEVSQLQEAHETTLKLWTALDDVRASLFPRTGEKRKQPVLDTCTSSRALWEQMDVWDEGSRRHRDHILEKWTAKLRANESRRPVSSGPQTRTVADALAEQLADPSERLIKRSRIPRSCAPIQASRKIGEDSLIYDDADLYQVLLKELVDQRAADGQTGSIAVGIGDGIGRSDGRSRKVVDRRASKGRKMRFTVHEKLQNLMAAEDRRSWEGQAIDRLFASLLGKRLELDEGQEGQEEQEEQVWEAREGKLVGSPQDGTRLRLF